MTVEQTLPYSVSTDQGDFSPVLDISIEKITPQIIEKLCQAQLDRTIKAGFYEALGRSAIDYRSDFETAIRKAMAHEQPYTNTRMLVLVEPRIPVKTQLELLNINLDPSVSYFPPHEPMWEPYPVWVKVIDNPSGLTKQELIKSLPDDLRPANLFEAVNADFSVILKDRRPIIVPSLQKAGSHSFQRYPGGNLELSYIHGFYGPEDSDSTDSNLYSRRKFQDVRMLASYLDKV